jgi:hypothetical protein
MWRDLCVLIILIEVRIVAIEDKYNINYYTVIIDRHQSCIVPASYDLY